jgi:hypothetical protein
VGLSDTTAVRETTTDTMAAPTAGPQDTLGPRDTSLYEPDTTGGQTR